MKIIKNSHLVRVYSPGTYLDVHGASRAIDSCWRCRNPSHILQVRISLHVASWQWLSAPAQWHPTHWTRFLAIAKIALGDIFATFDSFCSRSVLGVLGAFWGLRGASGRLPGASGGIWRKFDFFHIFGKFSFLKFLVKI